LNGGYGQGLLEEVLSTGANDFLKSALESGKLRKTVMGLELRWYPPLRTLIETEGRTTHNLPRLGEVNII
jgi:hypothetical protein